MDQERRSRRDEEEVAAAAGAVAADRPVVDGSTVSAEELRAEVDRDREPDQQRVQELRAEVAGTAEELAGRLDVPARVQVRKDQAAAQLRSARDSAGEHPGVLAGVAALLVLVVIARWRRRRRAQRE